MLNKNYTREKLHIATSDLRGETGQTIERPKRDEEKQEGFVTHYEHKNEDGLY